MVRDGREGGVLGLSWPDLLYRFALVGMVLAAIAVPLAIAGLPFIEFLNGMAAQPKARPQMTYGRVHGRELPVARAPVAGTVPREHVAYAFEHLGNTIEDARVAGAGLSNPVPVTLAALQAGRTVYETFCIVCHGPRGEGDGSVTGPDRFPAPPSLHTETARAHADGTIFHIITKGMGKMPPYGDRLDPQERWRAVHYVRVLQRAMNPQPGDR